MCLVVHTTPAPKRWRFLLHSPGNTHAECRFTL
jgi:hypothetical protein